MGKPNFQKLLEPSNIGQVKTRNRMIKTASGMSFCDLEQSGFVSEKERLFYEALAHGGVGLIIVGSCGVDYPLGTIRPTQLHIEDDKYIPSFAELTRTIHKYGCPTFLQLLHAGAWHQSQYSGIQPVSSSTLTENEIDMIPEFEVRLVRGLENAEIKEIIEKFVQAAERAQKADFDGVVINAATCHLLNSFLSRVWNKREDEYGYVSLENRSRVVVEIIEKVKQRLGQSFPVNVLFNVAEYGRTTGTTIQEGQAFARIFEEAGADSLEARGWGYEEYSSVNWPEAVFYPEPPKNLVKELDWSRRGAGAQVPLSAAVKKVVSIPVITEGRLDPILGEEILRRGEADFIGLTRRLIADPELPNKIAAGRLNDIAPCTACRNCLSASILKPSQCRINAAVGQEREYVIKPASQKKKVVVIGGGPAGMEAARVAALRGHEVTLFEREPKLGGALPLAAVVKGLEIEDLTFLVKYLKLQITKLGVKIRLGQEFDTDIIEQIKPDAVMIATGGAPIIPDIPGITRPNVMSNSKLHKTLKVYLRTFPPRILRWLTKFWMPVGKKVVIIGGGIQGCELAEFMVKRGRKVTIVESAKELGEGLVPPVRLSLLKWLTDSGVTMITEAQIREINEYGLVLRTAAGEQKTIQANTVVPALPLSQNVELLKTLDGKVSEIYAIGDCIQPRLIVDAIADGYNVALNL